ncbi:glycosyltransferase [Candidatus Pelagibacter sp.]|nr:glycosyltransferase [Candidatus Pelagibacter sp.]
MKKIKIGSIFEDSRYGGPHAQFINLFKTNDQIKTHVLISKIESDIFYKILKKSKIEVSKANIHPISKFSKYLYLYITFFFSDLIKIFSFIDKNNFELMYIPGGSNSFKSVIACIIKSKKFIWHIHDCHSNILFILIFSVLQNFASQVIFASNASKNYYSKFIYSKKKFIILQSSVKKIKVKKNNYNRFTIGSLSNFNPIKDLKLFIKVADLTGKIEKKINFLIAGNVWNTQKKYYLECLNLKKKLKLKNLKIINTFKKNNNFFNKINLYLCTSLKESSPLSLWESMSAGIPIITTNIGDIKKFNKETCYVINDRSPKEFVKKILVLYKKKKIYNRFSNNSINKYELNFSIKNYQKKFYKLLSGLN